MAYQSLKETELTETPAFDKCLATAISKKQIETFCQILHDINYTDDNLRDDTCKTYHQDDQNMTTYVILKNQLGLASNKRQQIYDLLLHNYFTVADLTVENIINITKTLIKQLKLNEIIDTNVFITIVRDNKLDGEQFNSLKNSRAFSNLFKAMKVPAKHYSKIFMHFKRWKSKDYTDVTEETEAETKTETIIQTKSIRCDIFMQSLAQKHQIIKPSTKEEINTIAELIKKYNYDENDLRNELCRGRDGNDKNLIIYKILCDGLGIKSNTIQPIYDTLLHEYFTLTDLDVTNVINVSKTLIAEFKLDDIIDTKMFSSVVYENNLDGKNLSELKNEKEFTDLFKSKINVSPEQFSDIFNWFMKWKLKDNDTKESVMLPVEEEIKYDNSVDVHTDFSENIIKCLADNNIILRDEVDDLRALNELFIANVYGEDELRNELCKALEQDDQELTIYKILFESEFDLGRDKRQQIYDILLHKYFKVINLNVD
eukprot:118759_1